MISGKAIKEHGGTQQKQDCRHKHADCRWESALCKKIERQIEQQHGNYAEVHVVMAIIVDHVPQVRLTSGFLHFGARTLIVGIVDVHQPFRGLFFQIELAVGKRLGKIGILLGVITSNFEGVHDTVPIPRSPVVI